MIIPFQASLKNIGKLVALFAALILLYVVSLYLAALLPDNRIRDRIKENAVILEAQDEYEDPFLLTGSRTVAVNYGMDGMMMNIVYNVSSEEPLKSVLMDKYTGDGGQYDGIRNFRATVAGNAPNEFVYARYWNGYIAVLRPLFMFFNYSDLRTANLFIFFLLCFLLIVLTARKIGFFAAIALAVALLFINFQIVPMIWVTIPVFYVAILASIVILLFDIKKEFTLMSIMIITSSLSVFFDILTAPLVSFGLPVLFILIRNDKFFRRQTFKQGLLFLVKLGACWILGYLLTWGMKPLIVSFYYPEVFSDFANQIALRSNGEDVSRIVAIYQNIKALCLVSYKIPSVIGILLLIVGLVLFRKKEKPSSLFYLYLIMALAPYVWYCTATQHSIEHSYLFTYRVQIITVFAVLLAWRETVALRR